MTTPNAELAYRVLDHIDAHPEQWNQGQWLRANECGTAACFAGWSVLLAGHKVEMSPPDEDGFQFYDAIDGDSTMSVRELAERDLGIADVEVPCQACRPGDCYHADEASEALFDGGNTRADLGRLVAEIFGPRPRTCCKSTEDVGHDFTCTAMLAAAGVTLDDVPPNVGSAS